MKAIIKYMAHKKYTSYAGTLSFSFLGHQKQVNTVRAINL